MIIVADGTAVTGLYFWRQRHQPDPSSFGRLADPPQDAALSDAVTQLGEYLAGERRDFDLELATRGDAFEEKVWEILRGILRGIPYGATTTYGSIASALGSKGLSQRVGQAVGRNPIGIIIPCHRVIGATGALTGYAGGLDRKRALLELEEPDEVSAGRLF